MANIKQVQTGQVGQQGKVNDQPKQGRKLSSDGLGAAAAGAMRGVKSNLVSTTTSDWLPPFESKMTKAELEAAAKNGGRVVQRMSSNENGEPIPLDLSVGCLQAHVVALTDEDVYNTEELSRDNRFNDDNDADKRHQMYLSSKRIETRVQALQAVSSQQVSSDRENVLAAMNDLFKKHLAPEDIKPEKLNLGADNHEAGYIAQLYALCAKMTGQGSIERAMHEFNKTLGLANFSKSMAVANSSMTAAANRMGGAARGATGAPPGAIGRGPVNE